MNNTQEEQTFIDPELAAAVRAQDHAEAVIESDLNAPRSAHELVRVVTAYGVHSSIDAAAKRAVTAQSLGAAAALDLACAQRDAANACAIHGIGYVPGVTSAQDAYRLKPLTDDQISELINLEPAEAITEKQWGVWIATAACAATLSIGVASLLFAKRGGAVFTDPIVLTLSTIMGSGVALTVGGFVQKSWNVAGHRVGDGRGEPGIRWRVPLTVFVASALAAFEAECLKSLAGSMDFGSRKPDFLFYLALAGAMSAIYVGFRAMTAFRESLNTARAARFASIRQADMNRQQTESETKVEVESVLKAVNAVARSEWEIVAQEEAETAANEKIARSGERLGAVTAAAPRPDAKQRTALRVAQKRVAHEEATAQNRERVDRAAAGVAKL